MATGPKIEKKIFCISPPDPETPQKSFYSIRTYVSRGLNRLISRHRQILEP